MTGISKRSHREVEADTGRKMDSEPTFGHAKIRSDNQHQLAFFDNCASRIAKKPVHYGDLLGSLVDASKPLSPLVAAVIEQWPFVVKGGNAANEKAVSEFIVNLLRNLSSAGENLRGLKNARDELANATVDRKLKSRFKKSLKGAEEVEQDVLDTEPDTSVAAPAKKIDKQDVNLEEIFGSLPTEGTEHNELFRWDQKELEESLEEGRVSELLLCLCSEHEEVRRQALPNISRFMMKLKVMPITIQPQSFNTNFGNRTPNTTNGGQHTFSLENYSRQ